jgi:hypothetical protein
MMYNDLGQTDKARAVLAEYTSVARSANEPQTTVPHLGQLARCVQSQAQVAGLVQEIFSLTDTAAYPPYEIVPALTLACAWFLQNSRGDPITLGRLEKMHVQMNNHQSFAAFHEVQAAAAEVRGEWEQAISHYEAAVAKWEILKRPYDILRTLEGLVKALSFAQKAGIRPETKPSIQDVQSKARLITEQLANQLDDPHLRETFLLSPRVKGFLER